MARSKLFIAFIVLEVILLFGAYLHGNSLQISRRTDDLEAKRALVSRLGLTDLAIWTEARYTRHPSQADFFSAFQDYPGSPDHFPAGSLISPMQVYPEGME